MSSGGSRSKGSMIDRILTLYRDRETVKEKDLILKRDWGKTGGSSPPTA